MLIETRTVNSGYWVEMGVMASDYVVRDTTMRRGLLILKKKV